MINLPIVVLSVWGAVYAGSVGVQLLQQRNYRGGIGASVLSLLVLIVPPMVWWWNQWR